MYFSHRIHIYDVNSKGNFISNAKGDLTFKVREVDEDKNFTKNFEEVTKKLKDDLKLNVEPVKAKLQKRM